MQPEQLQDLYFMLISLAGLAMIILVYFFIIKPEQHAKKIAKQKAEADREQKRKIDQLFEQYPTLSRYCTDASFQDTEIGYSFHPDTNV